MRLPRLIGVDRAADLISSGRSVGIDEALRLGLVDARAPGSRVGKVARELVLGVQPDDPALRTRRARKTVALPAPELAAKVIDRHREDIERRGGPSAEAALAAVDCMSRHLDVDRAEAIEVEVEGFLAVARSPIARHLVSVFLNDREIRRRSRRAARGGSEVTQALLQCPSGAPLSLAMDLACAGVEVRLGADEDAPPAAELAAAAIARLRRRARGGSLSTGEVDRAARRIKPLRPGTDHGRFDLLVENTGIDAGSRPSVLDVLGRRARENALVVSTAWVHPVPYLAEFVAGAGRFLGLRTLYVDRRAQVAEVAISERSDARAVATLARLLESMGRVALVVKGRPGYLCGRMTCAWLLAFERLVADGVDFRRIDQAVTAAGWDFGPAALLDRAGTGVAAAVVGALQEAYPERFALPQGLAMGRLAAAGRRGRAVGGGFWDYGRDADGRLVARDSGAGQAALGSLRTGLTTVSGDDVLERMLLAIGFEAARCLEEGLVDTAAVVDAAAVANCGFPPQLGGPLGYLDRLGAARACILARSHEALGPLYWPPVILSELSRTGGRFHAAC